MTNATDIVDFAGTSFLIADYVVFALFLCVSGGIGIYYSCKGQKDTSDYHLGGGQMHPVPVGISTGVSFMSAISLVGAPAEVFINGYAYVIGCIMGSLGYFTGCATIGYLMHRLGMKSLNEYYRQRFNSKYLNYAINIVVVLAIFHYMGGCMLGSIIAFNGVTDGEVSIIVALLVGGLIGIFYTTIGGLKAVIWSDVVQFLIMVVGISIVIVKSTIDTPGGISAIVNTNLEYSRFHPLDWTFDFTIRHTGWSMTIGLFVGWIAWSIQPACVQRLVCTKNVRDSVIVSIVAALLFAVFSILPAWAGFNIFGHYIGRGCDIYQAGWITENQIVLYYVRENLAWPGFQGLFIAALYAGSLSSFSSGLNAASSILWNDIIQPLLRVHVSDRRAVHISKAIVIVFGLLAMVWCYTLYLIGGLLLQLMASINGVVYGAYMGTFVLAILFKYSNARGALAGLVISFGITLWVSLGKVLNNIDNRLLLPSVTENCSPNVTLKLNNVTSQISTTPESFVDVLYSISYEWLTSFCVVVSLLSALMASVFFKPYEYGQRFTLFATLRRGNCKTSPMEGDIEMERL